MDIEVSIVALNILREIGRPLRIPTLTWLFSDYFGIIDIQARELITFMIRCKWLRNTGMGWIEVAT